MAISSIAESRFVMNDTTEILFTGHQQGLLSITIIGRERPESDSYWDGNWLLATIKVKTDKFSANVSGTVRADELVNLSRDLQLLHDTLEGNLVFTTIEEWISFRIDIDKLGGIRLSGKISDNFLNDTYLIFSIITDQSFLSIPLSQLRQATNKFPVIGKP